MTEGRLIQAALAAPDVRGLLDRLMPARSRPWLDDLLPLGYVECEGRQIAYSLIEVCGLLGGRPPAIDPMWQALRYVATPANDRALPWGQRRLELTTADAMQP